MKASLILVLVLAFACSLIGQPSLSATNTLTLPADYASFYIPADSTIYIELYYSLYRHQLGFIGSERNNYRYAGVLASAVLFDETGLAIDSASTYFLSQVKDAAEQGMTNVRLFNYLPIKVSPGRYRIELSVIDDVSKATGQAILQATVPDYPAGSLVSSDLELAYAIRDVQNDSASVENSRLIKEGRVVIPNPTGIYDPAVDSVLYVYSELYGLFLPGDGGFTIRYLVKDSIGNMIHDYGQATHNKPGSSAVLSQLLDIRPLKPGPYYLFLEVEDIDSGERTMTMHRFSILAQEPTIATLNPEDIELMVDIAWYHLSEAEKMQLDDLTPQGKANLIRQFWREQDDNPGNPENQVYDEAVRRFSYANEQFSTDFENRNGWHTDRGRVYITYGPYDEQIEEVMTGKSFPYIIWKYYQLEGGVVFVFVNDFVAGAADYRLVHSTHPREKYDPRWETILKDADQQEDEWLDGSDKNY